MKKDVIHMKNMSVKFNEVIILQDVSLDINASEFTVVIGPNGAGKTTLIKSILGLIHPTKGVIEVFGHDPLHEGEHIRKIVGYVPQYIRISDVIPMNVLEAVLMGVLAKKKPPRIPSKTDIQSALEALKVVDMVSYRERYIHELSGGERQRVLIARAMVRKPKYLILDEPFTGVDVKSQRELLEFLYKIHTENNVGMLIVVHDLAPIIRYVDKILLLNKRVVAYGSPKDVLKKETIKEAYGAEVEILEHDKICYPLLGDVHRQR
jgi:ABC-type Mn2+/Zn2+ transport system ATPase subunit